MKSKNITTNLLISLVSLTLFFVALETVFRLPFIQQKTGGNGPALHRWWDNALTLELNSLGFRDQEHQLNKPADTKRILILGDSIVYGQMVELDQIFPEVLEANLNRKNNPKIEVINMGLMGWNTALQLESFVKNGLQFKPDLVIIAFYLNDPQVKRLPRPEEDFHPDRPIIPLISLDQYLDKKSYFYSFAKFRYNRLLEKLGLKTDYYTWQKSFFNPNLRGWKQFAISLEKINTISQANQIDTLFLSLNWQPGWEKETNMALTEAKKLSIPILDMYPYFSQYSYTDLQVSPSDWHPNQQAHQIYADVLTKYLLQHSLIK